MCKFIVTVMKFTFNIEKKEKKIEIKIPQIKIVTPTIPKSDEHTCISGKLTCMLGTDDDETPDQNAEPDMKKIEVRYLFTPTMQNQSLFFKLV